MYSNVSFIVMNDIFLEISKQISLDGKGVPLRSAFVIYLLPMN